jgi:hypothetical protein
VARATAAQCKHPDAGRRTNGERQRDPSASSALTLPRLLDERLKLTL